MRNFIVIVLLVFTFQSGLKAQYGDRQIVADVYYGYSVFGSADLTLNYTGVELDFNKKYLGPFGFRAEYMVSDEFGIGLDFNMRQKNIESSYTSSLDNLDYDISFDSRQIRAMARFSYYLHNEDNLQVYSGLGIGYVNRKLDFVATEAGVDYNIGDLLNFPIAARAYGGARYFFTDNIGINVEMGIGGGSLITGGVSFGI